MNAPRTLAAVALVLVGGAALLYVAVSGDRPNGAASEPERSAAVAAPRADAALTPVAEPAPLVTQAEAPTATRDVVASAPATGPERSLTVEVVLPQGTPPDPDLQVVLVADREAAPSMWETLDGLRAGTLGWRVVQAPVSADGTARLAVPADVDDAWILLDGRHLFLEDVLSADLEAGRMRLEPRLGACVTVRFTGEGSEGEILFSGGSFSGGGWGWRERELEADRVHEYRGVDPRLTWSVFPNLERAYGKPAVGIELAPGEERTIAIDLTPGGSVAGVVVDGSGDPLSGVRVQTADGSPWLRGADVKRTTSGADGHFELRGLAPGERSFEASMRTWRDATIEDVELAEGQRVDDLRFELDRGERIAGHVLFADGRPAVDAQVRVVALERRQGWGNWGGPRRRVVGSMNTNDEGDFAVTGLAPGTYTVGVSAAWLPGENGASGELVPAEVPLQASEEAVEAGRTDVELVLAGAVVVSGRVVDDRGEPVTAFRLELESNQGELRVRDEEGREITTGKDFESPDGRFVLTGAGPGVWNLIAEAEGHVQEEPLALVVTEAGPLAGELELVLLRTARVSGVVTAAGRARPGTDVAVQREGRANPWAGAPEPDAVTDEAGRFELVELAPGPCELVAAAEGWADSAPVVLELQPGEVREDVQLALREGARIVGHVTAPDGDPIVGRRISWGPNAMGFGSRAETRSDVRGNFLFEHVTPGEWAVSAGPSMAEMSERMGGRQDQSAWIDMMGELLTATVTVADGEEVELYLGGEPKRPVRIHGRVTRAGEPLVEAQVTAVSEGTAVFQGMKAATTDAEGRYELVVDRPGGHVVSARTDDRGAVGVEVLVDVPREDELRVDLAVPLGRIEGILRKPGGGVAANLQLNLQRDDGLGRVRWGGDQARSDEEGRYVFEALEAGTYTVRANVSSWTGRFDDRWGTSIRSGIDVPEDGTASGIDFRLEESGRVAGMVEGPDGTPVDGASVFFRDAGGQMLARVSATVTDGSGRFERKGLAPGTYTLSARSGSMAANDVATVRVASGEVSDTRLVLETGTTVLVRVEGPAGEARRARVEVLGPDGRDVAGILTLEELRSIFNEGASSLETRVGPFPAGRYTVRAALPDGETLERKVRLRGRGDEKEVTLKLDG